MSATLSETEAAEFGIEPEAVTAPAVVQAPEPVTPRISYKQPQRLPEAHRPLPASLDAEMGVLSSILLSPKDTLLNVIEKGVSDTHFHHPAHGTIFGVLIDLWKASAPIDLLTVTQALADRNLLEQIGGPAVLANLQTFLPTAANAEYYLDIVKEKHLLRKMISVCTTSAARCYEEQGDVKTLLDDVEKQIFTVSKTRIVPEAEILPPRRFDILTPPPKPAPSLYLAGQGVCTAGNLTQITGQAKTAKSSLVGAILANAFDGREHLGIHGAGNKQGRALVHNDTEQSRYDHHQLVLGAMHRAGVTASPDWLRSYSLADVPTAERRKLLSQEMEAAAKAHGGIYQVIIDGVADLCHDPNDPEEAFGLVEELHRLAITFDCSILGILHLNPGSDFKTRGHLGSQLERKAESTLALERDKEGDSITLWMPPSRHGHLPRDQGPRFAWDDATGRHELIEGTRKDVKSAAKAKDDLAKWRELASQLFNKGPRSYQSAVDGLMKLRNVTDRTAQRHIADMTAQGVIRKNLLNDYELVDE